MDRIRVLLGNYPMMIPDALRQMIVEQDDMQLVGDVRGPMKILQEAGKVKADVVVLAQNTSEELGLCSQLLAVYPDLTIVSIGPDSDSAFTQQLCSQRQIVHADDHVDILQAMRIAVKQPCKEI